VNSLLEVVVIYHPDDQQFFTSYTSAIKRAFEYATVDPELSQFKINDPFERIRVTVATTSDEILQSIPIDEVPVLFIFLITDTLVKSPEHVESLNELAELIAENSDNGRINALCYSDSGQAIGKLPQKLQNLQVRFSAQLGESALVPHVLTLIALNRACKLLSNQAKLTLFLSHAKSDGMFLARAIKSYIEEIKSHEQDLSSWYDAVDIPSGSLWKDELRKAASTSVLIAIRTNAYDLRQACREEFETAVDNCVPILVVDATQSTLTAASPLPYSAMPTVRVVDGNTHRILVSALREHLRLLLMKHAAFERVPLDQRPKLKVWPRFPPDSLFYASINNNEYWVVPQSTTRDRELLAARDWLEKSKANLKLITLEALSSGGFAQMNSSTNVTAK
jgi:hypothetical protein